MTSGSSQAVSAEGQLLHSLYASTCSCPRALDCLRSALLFNTEGMVHSYYRRLFAEMVKSSAFEAGALEAEIVIIGMMKGMKFIFF